MAQPPSHPSKFVMCCMGPILNPDKDDGYYVALGLTRDANTASIRKAFRTASLALHPDKLRQRGQTATPEMVEAFRAKKEAYECLSDGKRRALYDHLGEVGLRLQENPTSVTPEMVARVLGHVGLGCRCGALLVLAAILGFLFVFFPLTFALNVDSRASVPWAVVFLPVWALDAYVLLCHGLWVAEACRGGGGPEAPVDEELGSGAPHAPDGVGGGPAGAEGHPAPSEDDDEDGEDHFEIQGEDASLGARAFYLLQCGLVVAFQIALVYKLDTPSTDRKVWPAVFSPLLLREVLALVSLVPPSVRKLALEDFEDEASPLTAAALKERACLRFAAECEARDAARSAACAVGFRLAQEVLLVCKLAGAGGGGAVPWFAVFAPLWCYGALQFGRAAVLARVSRAIAAKMSDPPPEAPPGDDSWMTDEDRSIGEASAAAAASGIGAGCTGLCLVLVLLLVALKASEIGGVPALAIFAPVLAVVGCCYCCACATVCLWSAPPDDDVEAAGENGTGAVSKPAAEATPVAEAVVAQPTPAPPPTTTPLFEAASAAPAPAPAADDELEMGDLD